MPLRDPEPEGLRLDRRQDPLPNQLGQEQIDAKRVAVESWSGADLQFIPANAAGVRA